jgi:hypothetical protein
MIGAGLAGYRITIELARLDLRLEKQDEFGVVAHFCFGSREITAAAPFSPMRPSHPPRRRLSLFARKTQALPPQRSFADGHSLDHELTLRPHAVVRVVA